MQLSYVILTHNRRESLLRTLRVLTDHTPLPETQWEAIVVDNASTDGTTEAIEHAFPRVRVLRQVRNLGSPARNIGARAAAGEQLMFLDDDSYPCGDTALQCVMYMQQHRRVGAVGGKVILPDGTEDAAALPIVMPACALCVRRDAFLSIGGFCNDFFRQAEEYDLIFRLLMYGWDVRRLEWLVFRHDKVLTSRSNALIQHMDLRNNLVLAARFLPPALRREYRRDWLRRYIALAKYDGEDDRQGRAIVEARRAISHEARSGRKVLDPALVEVIFQHRRQEQLVRQWAKTHGVHRVLIADYTKNIYATWQACQASGLEVTAVCDNHRAYQGKYYRDVPIITDDLVASQHTDGIVLSNINPAHVDRRAEQLAGRFGGSLPILQLWHSGADEPSLHPVQQQHRRWNDQYPRVAV